MPRRDGSNSPAVIGVDAAASLVFQIFDTIRALNPDLREPARAMPADLAQVDVCLASDGVASRINSPLRGSVYTLRANPFGVTRIVLIARADANAGTMLVRRQRLSRQ